MLDEARRRRERGEDVVVAALQSQQPGDLQALVQKLELVPPLQMPEGQTIDVEAVLRRSPQVCVIDPLAAQNLTGSRNSHRWQDVQELLRNGISVLTSVNLLHVEARKRFKLSLAKTLLTRFPSHFSLQPMTSSSWTFQPTFVCGVSAKNSRRRGSAISGNVNSQNSANSPYC
jgi:two-component system, OmpR family, sensor histidine kinase KdpD